MSIGFGIFLSAFLLVLAWQIDKHGRWRTARKIGLWFAAVAALSGAVFGGIVLWENSSESRKLAAEIESIHAGRATHYSGLELGLGQNEVVYRKGSPAERHDDGAHPYWTYRPAGVGNGDLFVWWTSAKTVAGVGCANGKNRFDCDVVAGVVALGTSEAEIKAKFGTPATEEPPDEKGTKSLSYGKGPSRFKFLLSESKVAVILLLAPDEAPRLDPP